MDWILNSFKGFFKSRRLLVAVVTVLAKYAHDKYGLEIPIELIVNMAYAIIGGITVKDSAIAIGGGLKAVAAAKQKVEAAAEKARLAGKK